MKNNLVWIDLEMTGLDPKKDRILEIAAIVTDSDLEVISEGISLVIKRDPSLFKQMDEWNQKHHSQSGLWEKVINSGIEESEAERQILEHIKPYTEVRSNPLCGNSIWQDRRFIIEYMPSLDQHLHYRNVDVSTLKELVTRWYNIDKANGFTKKNTHRALDDILESIDELKFYRQNFFVSDFLGRST